MRKEDVIVGILASRGGTGEAVKGCTLTKAGLLLTFKDGTDEFVRGINPEYEPERIANLAERAIELHVRKAKRIYGKNETVAYAAVS